MMRRTRGTRGAVLACAAVFIAVGCGSTGNSPTTSGGPDSSGASTVPASATLEASIAAPSEPATDAPPSIEPTPTPGPTPVVYVVRAGDNLTKIARRFKITLEALRKANPKIKDPNKIKVGDKLVIPSAAPGPTATP